MMGRLNHGQAQLPALAGESPTSRGAQSLW